MDIVIGETIGAVGIATQGKVLKKFPKIFGVAFKKRENKTLENIIFFKNLVTLAAILNKIDDYVRVEGHADNLPIKNEYFNSNWQLSSIRASNIVEFLVGQGNISPDRLSAVGYGEYRPVAENNIAEGRAKNRRADILILNNKYDNIEINN